MPPTKVPATSLARRPISTRQQKSNVIGDHNTATISGKRKADASPLRNDKVKRAALGNLTNAVLNANNDDTKKGVALKPQQQPQDLQAAKKQIGSIAQQTIKQRATKVLTRAASRASHTGGAEKKRVNIGAVNAKLVGLSVTAVKPKKKTEIANGKSTSQPNSDDGAVPITRRLSIEIDQTECEESIYMSAHEDL